MSVHEREEDGVLVVRPTAERITQPTEVKQFKTSLRRVRENGYLAIAIDLQDVRYVNNQLVSVLLTESKLLARIHGLIYLFSVRTELREFFRQTIVDYVLEIHKDKSSAIARFTDSPKRIPVQFPLATVLAPVYVWLHRVSVTIHRRRRSGRRAFSDRRGTRDRHLCFSQASASSYTAHPPEPVSREATTASPDESTSSIPVKPPAGLRRAGGRRPYGTTTAEAKILQAMIHMRHDNLSFQRIADELNMAGYRNQSGGSWAKGNVYTILKRYTGDTNAV